MQCGAGCSAITMRIVSSAVNTMLYYLFGNKAAPFAAVMTVCGRVHITVALCPSAPPSTPLWKLGVCGCERIRSGLDYAFSTDLAVRRGGAGEGSFNGASRITFRNILLFSAA